MLHLDKKKGGFGSPHSKSPLGVYLWRGTGRSDNSNFPIVDDLVVNDGCKKGAFGCELAYGPLHVVWLAQNMTSRGGGAARASYNADSYAAWAAHSMHFFYQARGILPLLHHYRHQRVAQHIMLPTKTRDAHQPIPAHRYKYYSTTPRPGLEPHRPQIPQVLRQRLHQSECFKRLTIQQRRMTGPPKHTWPSPIQSIELPTGTPSLGTVSTA